ncbi:hypothetical protein TSUD_386050 [Trifolium subterraneum]|uniref:Uncharacterized protein n=1 Tax=Trifolium subterraneum TaxID=3900 RepID=A0A2Z6LX03_TRISU|nr:hypothetical protein TSUD_386050 [Trifolium subterraneum]
MLGGVGETTDEGLTLDNRLRLMLLDLDHTVWCIGFTRLLKASGSNIMVGAGTAMRACGYEHDDGIPFLVRDLTHSLSPPLSLLREH